jgi:hypothetical protein
MRFTIRLGELLLNAAGLKVGENIRPLPPMAINPGFRDLPKAMGRFGPIGPETLSSIGSF